MNRKILAGAVGLGAVALAGGLYLAAPATAGGTYGAAVAAADQVADQGGQHGKPGRMHGARRLFHGVHGEATVKRDGKFVQVGFQRGQVSGVSGATVTVKSKDGASWSWTTNGDTRVRKDGAKSALDKVAAGDNVFVFGTVNGNDRTAKIVVVPKKK